MKCKRGEGGGRVGSREKDANQVNKIQFAAHQSRRRRPKVKWAANVDRLLPPSPLPYSFVRLSKYKHISLCRKNNNRNRNNNNGNGISRIC